MKKIFNVIYVSIIINSCGAGIGDTSIDLSNGYIYRTDGAMRYILTDNIFKDEIHPNVICYAYNEEYIIALQRPNKKFIELSLTTELQVRSNFLVYNKDTSIEDYQFMKSIFLSKDSIYVNLSKKISGKNTLEDRELCKKKAMYLLKNDPYYLKMLNNDLNLWIIQHSTKKTFGPYIFTEFDKKVIELNIPKQLIEEFKRKVIELNL